MRRCGNCTTPTCWAFWNTVSGLAILKLMRPDLTEWQMTCWMMLIFIAVYIVAKIGEAMYYDRPYLLRQGFEGQVDRTQDERGEL
jgi:hypothetical protein